MGFRESRPSNVFFPVGSPIFFVNGSLIFFGTYGCFRCGKKEHPLISLGGRALEIFHRPGSVAATAQQGAFLAPGVER